MEIALKVRLGKLALSAPFGTLVPVEARHVEPLTTLPLHHKDPFDRWIAATALVEGMTLVSADAIFDAYGVTRLW